MTSQERIEGKSLSEAREYHSGSSGIFFKIKDTLYRENSPFQKIEVVENEHFGRILLLDGLVQTTEKDEFFYHEMLVHPAFISHSATESILIIGGGDGGALREVLRYPSKRVTLVEIDSRVIEVAKRYFPWLSPALEDGRSELVVSDGSQFIKTTESKFDIVFIDSSDPVGPSSALHEREFYDKLKKCLNPKGIVAAQVGSPFFHMDSIKKKNSFLKEIFKVVRFYLGPVPTYPGGSWCYVFLSDEVHPSCIERNPPSELRYFNLEIHRAAFALPAFLREIL